MRPSLHTQRLIALCIAGAVALNFPLLALWDVDTRLFGLPLMPTALFAGWAVLIGCAAWIVHIKRKADSGDRDPGDDATSEDG